MNWAIFIALLTAHVGIGTMAMIRRQNVSWLWAAVVAALALAGWTIMSMNAGRGVLSALVWVSFWSWQLRRRIKLKRRTSEVRQEL